MYYSLRELFKEKLILNFLIHKVLKHYLEETYIDSREYLDEFYEDCQNGKIDDLDWLASDGEMDDFVSTSELEYIRIYDYTKDIKKIMYNETEVNTFYIYITLRNLYYSNFAKYGKSIKTKKIYLFTEMDENKFNKIYNSYFEDYELHSNKLNKKIKLDELFDKIDKTIDGWYWYDKKLTKLYFDSGMSMRDLSKETKISLSSIFNTLTNAKEKIRQNTKEEYRKYKS